jgi:hypothetical protein
VERDFLREHPEELVRVVPSGGAGYQGGDGLWQNPRREAISRFLGWGMKRVEQSLADIHAIESGDVVEDVGRNCWCGVYVSYRQQISDAIRYASDVHGNQPTISLIPKIFMPAVLC